MPTHVITFVVTVALLVMLPGAGNAAISRQTLAFGRRAGWLTVAGTSSGILVWAISAAAGLSAILLANPGAFLLIRITGAGVLGVLGLQTLWSLRQDRATSPASHQSESSRGGRSFGVGLATSLGNPKAGVFAVSLLPQFVTSDGPVPISSIALGCVWALISATWFCGFVYVLDRGRVRMATPAVHRGMQAVTGLTMLGLGVAVAIGG